MAECCQKPSSEYFPVATLRENNTAFTTSPYLWEQPYSTSPDSYNTADSTLPSPKAIVQPSLYNLPEEEYSQIFKTDTPFNLPSFQDWVDWDTALTPKTAGFSPDFKMESISPKLQQSELQGDQYRDVIMAKGIEDSSVVFEDDQMSQSLFSTTEQPRENFYSTPLSWSPPIVSIKTEAYTHTSPMTARQRSKLIAQAMPSRTRIDASSPSSVESFEAGKNGLKRNSTVDAPDVEKEEPHSPQPAKRNTPVKKTAHNMIEKRYRTNLNDKIAALRDSVPSLRTATNAQARGEEAVEDLQGLTPAHKLNKATVLSRATEYISHLEKRNRTLSKENAVLKSRIEAFEILTMAREPEQQRQALNQQQIRNQSRQESSARYKVDGWSHDS